METERNRAALIPTPAGADRGRPGRRQGKEPGEEPESTCRTSQGEGKSGEGAGLVSNPSLMRRKRVTVTRQPGFSSRG